MVKFATQNKMIKETLFSGWHFVRWLRLVLGIFIAMQAIETKDALSGLIAAFFLFQAVSNTGCCGTDSCAINPQQKKLQENPVKSNEKLN
jgi:hypothetical protein